MQIKTDYTKDGQKNTLCCAPLDRYRLVNWLRDLVANYFSSPINIHDERLANILRIQDGIEPDECRAIFRIGLPYSKDSRKACTTPAVLVSVGQTQYMNNMANTRMAQVEETLCPTFIGEAMAMKQIGATIAVLTESLEGTLLLCDSLENFFVLNADKIAEDYGGISKLIVTGSSEPTQLASGDVMNAKEIYQSAISMTLLGGMSWITDTQGPVFRGITATLTVK